MVKLSREKVKAVSQAPPSPSNTRDTSKDWQRGVRQGLGLKVFEDEAGDSFA